MDKEGVALKRKKLELGEKRLTLTEHLLTDINFTLKEIRDLLRAVPLQGTSGPSMKDYIRSCNCNLHKHGEPTGGWYCPTYGQQL